MVYNTNTANEGAATKEVTPGFYYWNVNKWERIVNQSQLDTAITNVTNLQGDVTKIKALLDAAYGSNNLGETPTTGAFGGMVFTPASGTQGEASYVPAKIEYVYFDGTQYVKQDMTTVLNDIITPETGNVIYNSTNNVFQYWDGDSYETITLSDLVQANESKTGFVTGIDANGGTVIYYVGEDYLSTNEFPTAEVANGWATSPATKPDTITILDVPTAVSTNFKTILDQTTTILLPGSTTEYYTVKQYIQQVASNNGANVGYTTVAIPASGTVGQPGYQAAIPANSFYTVDPTTGVKTAINLGTLVQEHETDTSFERKTGTGAYQAAETTEPSAEAGKVVYKYNAEGTTQYLDITADVLESVNNNTSVKNAIKNILNTGGAVYYGDHDSNASTPDVLYHIVETTNEPIVVPIDIQQLITTISNASQDNKNIIKTQLGDVLVGPTEVDESALTTFVGTSVVTGDTFNGKAVRKGVFLTKINANTATTSGVALDVAASEIISITVKYNGGLVANVTNLIVSGTDVEFNIGTGNMYQVLGNADIIAEVIIEFAVQ